MVLFTPHTHTHPLVFALFFLTLTLTLPTYCFVFNRGRGGQALSLSSLSPLLLTAHSLSPLTLSHSSFIFGTFIHTLSHRDTLPHSHSLSLSHSLFSPHSPLSATFDLVSLCSRSSNHSAIYQVFRVCCCLSLSLSLPPFPLSRCVHVRACGSPSFLPSFLLSCTPSEKSRWSCCVLLRHAALVDACALLFLCSLSAAHLSPPLIAFSLLSRSFPLLLLLAFPSRVNYYPR
ncbi:MAG: hypothetical protein J3Q66DRAFT_127777 [Benniella sp.]|nr:MAG: hypothetical protein J3Q66DRAFT_127777 [Benniella sp.]